MKKANPLWWLVLMGNVFVMSLLIAEAMFLFNYSWEWLRRAPLESEMLSFGAFLLAMVAFVPVAGKRWGGPVPEWQLGIIAISLVSMVVASEVRRFELRSDEPIALIVQAIAAMIFVGSILHAGLLLAEQVSNSVVMPNILLLSLVLGEGGLVVYLTPQFSDWFRQKTYWVIVAGTVGITVSLGTLVWRNADIRAERARPITIQRI